MATTWQLSKEILLMVVLNISLPTVDVYSDLALIFKFFRIGHKGWAGVLLVPFLLNYLFAWILWWRLDKNKRISWVAAVLGCYPQYYAARVIWALWSDFERGLAKKKILDREMSEYEVFLESVFSVLGITYIFVKASSTQEKDGGHNRELVIGKVGSLDEFMFFLAYSTSILTTSLGLAKCLKIGPCRVLGEGGAMGGLCSGRFLLLMVTVAATLVGKGTLLPSTVGFMERSNIEGIIVVVCTMFLPGLLLAFISLCHSKESFKIMLSHPSLLLMPVFTHFTFAMNRRCCTREEEEGGNNTRITFYKKWTLVNVGVSVMGHVCFVVIMKYGIERDCWGDDCVLNAAYPFLTLPIASFGILTTLVFLFLDRCCSCCSCTPDFQKATLQVNDPLNEYVVDKDTKQIVQK